MSLLCSSAPLSGAFSVCAPAAPSCCMRAVPPAQQRRPLSVQASAPKVSFSRSLSRVQGVRHPRAASLDFTAASWRSPGWLLQTPSQIQSQERVTELSELVVWAPQGQGPSGALGPSLCFLHGSGDSTQVLELSGLCPHVHRYFSCFRGRRVSLFQCRFHLHIWVWSCLSLGFRESRRPYSHRQHLPGTPISLISYEQSSKIKSHLHIYGMTKE